MRAYYYQLWWALACIVFFGVLVRIALIHRLRSVHPDTWESLGRPTILGSTIGHWYKEARFLFSLRFRSLGDRSLLVPCVTLMLLQFCAAIVFGMLLAGIFFPGRG